MRLCAMFIAVVVAAGFAAPSASAGSKPGRRLGAAYAKKRAATPIPAQPPVVILKSRVKSRVQSAGSGCRSQAKG